MFLKFLSMIHISREFKTGVFVIAVIALFIWGYNYLKGHNLFDGPSNTFFTEYNNVQGLNTASVVTVNGYEVGKVVDISFNTAPDKKGALKVEFSVEHDFEFSINSIAKIYSASLMGGKSLAIVPSYEGENAVPGDFLNGEIESDMFSSVEEKLNPLQAKLENVIVSADSLLVHLNTVIDDESKIRIKSTIKNLDLTMANLNEITKHADELLVLNKENVTRTLQNVEKITENLERFSDSLAQVNVQLLAQKIATTLQGIESLTTGINNGKGTLGKLVNDDAVYDNLKNATKELEALLKDVKLHPKRFVHFSLFGKKEKEYQDTLSMPLEK